LTTPPNSPPSASIDLPSTNTDTDVLAQSTTTAELEAVRRLIERENQSRLEFEGDQDEVEHIRQILAYRAQRVKELEAEMDKLEKANAVLAQNTKMQSVKWKITDISDPDWIPSLSKLLGVVFPADSVDPYLSDDDNLFPPPPRKRRDDGSTIFVPYTRTRGFALLPNFMCTDARALAEIVDPSLPIDDPNHFLTVRSPNVKYILQCPIGWRDVHARKNGRYGMDDFTAWPQHVHPATMHLIFVRRCPDDVKKHGWVWGDIWNDPVFVVPTGQCDDNFRMRTQPMAHIWDTVIALRRACKTLRVARQGQGGTGQLSVLCSSMTVMAGALRGATFSKRDITLIITGIQRYYLDTIALYEYLTKWVFLLAAANAGSRRERDKIPEVHVGVMGAFTTDPIILDKLYQLGIRVFFIQPSRQVSRITTIRRVVESIPFSGVTEDHAIPYPSLYQGRASAATCIAAQDIVLGGITYGLQTQGNLRPYNPYLAGDAQLSQVQEVGGPSIFGQ